MHMSISTPAPGAHSLMSASTGGPAVFAAASAGRGDLQPVIFPIRTPGKSLSLAVTVSPAPSRANPMMSNPHETFDTDAGANAETSLPMSDLVK